MTVQPNIVLVHGAWADGSCWSGVIERLQADGYNVTAPQFPESSLTVDVARLRQVLRRQDGPTIAEAAISRAAAAARRHQARLQTCLGQPVSRSAHRPGSECASPWPMAPRSALRAA